MDIRDTILELISSRKVRTVLLTEGQFIGKYICSNCNSDWKNKILKDDDDEEYEDNRCSKCGIPDMGEYKVFVNAEKDTYDEEI